MKNDGAEHVCIDVCGAVGACNEVISGSANEGNAMGRERRIACVEICSCVPLDVVSGYGPYCHVYSCFLRWSADFTGSMDLFLYRLLGITSFQMELWKASSLV